MDLSRDRKKAGKITKAPLTECRECGKIGIMLPNCEGMHLNCFKRNQDEKADRGSETSESS